MIHPPENEESQIMPAWNLEGSVRSAGVRSMPGGIADLIEAGLNEAAGRFGAMGIWVLVLALGVGCEGRYADRWFRRAC